MCDDWKKIILTLYFAVSFANAPKNIRSYVRIAPKYRCLFPNYFNQLFLMNNQNNSSQQLTKELATLLTKSHAHVSFEDVVKNIPFDDLGKKPNGVPYSIWQQLEHI